MLDFGYPQSTSTEMLKLCVHNEAQVVETNSPQKLLNLNPRSVPSNAVHRPVGPTQGGSGKNEIFVDILERITVLLNANGYGCVFWRHSCSFLGMMKFGHDEIGSCYLSNHFFSCIIEEYPIIFSLPLLFERYSTLLPKQQVHPQLFHRWIYSDEILSFRFTGTKTRY